MLAQLKHLHFCYQT